jgi:molecular chaperone GrpE
VIAPREDSTERRPAGPDTDSGRPARGGDASVLGPPEPTPPAGQPTDKDAQGPSAGATAPAANAAADRSAEVQADIDALLAAEQARDEYLELAKRTQADFENYRRRMAAEVQAAATRGKAELATQVVGVIDTLEKALEAAGVESAEGPAPEDPLAEGFFLTYRELCAALRRSGVEAFDPAGEPFDPNRHEALQKIAVEGAAPGTVIEVMQKGYSLDDQLIRPARVVVAE